MSNRECPSCGGASSINDTEQCSYCGLDLAALRKPVAPSNAANLTDADRAALPALLEIGRRNLWIRDAWDPAFNERSFYRCTSRDELRQKFEHGNWSNGTAFGFESLWFIEQGNGNDEWLTVKTFDDRPPVAFESISWHYIITRGDAGKFNEYLDRLVAATAEQCQTLTY